jgi:hypothetical protein
MDGEGKEVPRETARRVLQAAAVEAHGSAGVHVTHARVMGRADMVDWEGFKAIAEYLEWRGWIADAAAEYDVFTVKKPGVGEAMK